MVLMVSIAHHCHHPHCMESPLTLTARTIVVLFPNCLYPTPLTLFPSLFSPHQYEELVEKDEMALAMKSLLAGYPPSCRNADVSSLKKMIAIEKQR
jgi:hypothetical protein